MTGGAVGPAPDVQHQPACHGNNVNITCNNCSLSITLVAKWSRQLASMHEVIGSRPAVIFFVDILNFLFIWPKSGVYQVY